MSPPCLATVFEGDNGGATFKGVSATEIRVGIPVGSGFTAAAGSGPYGLLMNGLFEHLNRSYEFYGRRLVPVYVEGAASGAAGSRAQGAQVAAQAVFAALTGWQEYNYVAQVGMVQELARNQVVSVTRNAGPWWSDKMLYDALHPYVWSTYPSLESRLANFADLTCSRLAQRPARHALDAGMQGATRRFGVLAAGQQVVPAVRPLVDALAACGVPPVVAEWSSANSAGSAGLRGHLERFRSEGVTTIICACEGMSLTSVMSEAGSTGFQPEWLTGPVSFVTGETVFQGFGKSSLIRLDPGPRVMPLQTRPWFRVLLDTVPTFASADQAMLQNAFLVAEFLYDQLMVMAAGIQGAGPNLTPDSFAAGLMTMQFPNPGAGQPPYWQPSAGFGPGDHSFYDDYTLSWWSDTAPAVEPYSSNPFGSWCYLGGGERFDVGLYPADIDLRINGAGEACR